MILASTVPGHECDYGLAPAVCGFRPATALQQYDDHRNSPIWHAGSSSFALVSSGSLQPQPGGRALTTQRSRLVVILAFTGLVLGLVAATLRPPSYESFARVTVLNPVESLQDELQAFESEDLLRIAEAELGFLPEVRVEAIPVQNILTVFTVADSGERAAQAANVMAEAYRSSRIASAVRVGQSGQVPDAPFAPNRSAYMLLGTVLGAIIGFGATFALRLFDRSQNGTDHRASEPHAGPEGPERHTFSNSQDTSANLGSVSSAGATIVPEWSADTPPSHTSHTAVPVVEDEEPTVRILSPIAAPRPVAAAGLHAEPAVVPVAAKPTTSRQTSPATEVDRTERTPAPTHETGSSAPANTSGTEQISTTDDDAPDSAPRSSERSHSTPVERTMVAPPTPRPPTPRPESPAVAARKPTQPRHSGGDIDTDIAAETRRRDVDDDGGSDRMLISMRLEHERDVLGYKAEIARLNKDLRGKVLALNEYRNGDQGRISDLETQIELLERELSKQRSRLDRERIAHTRALTEENGRSDRSLDNARRRFRAELSKHADQHRSALIKAKAEFDDALAVERSDHAKALEADHARYERALQVERERSAGLIDKSRERINRELHEQLEAERTTHKQSADKHRSAISSLRRQFETADAEAADLRITLQRLQRELKRARGSVTKASNASADEVATMRDEVAELRKQLASEQNRVTSLRSDLSRRIRVSNEAMTRDLAGRSHQLAELEASIAKQREYADKRVREVTIAADEAARAAAVREAELLSTIARLERGQSEVAAPSSNPEEQAR